MIDPAIWQPGEIDWMRILFAAVLLIDPITRGHVQKARRPVGIARAGSLDAITRHKGVIEPLYCLAAVVFATGRFEVVSVLFLAVVQLVFVTAQASNGAVGHARFMASLVLAIHVAADASRLISDARGIDISELEHQQQTTWWIVQSIVALYFVSGVSKVAKSGFGWTGRSAGLLINVDVKRTDAITHGEPTSERIISFLMRHRRLTTIMFSLGLLVELFAPVGLLNRWTAAAVGALFIMLHRVSGVLLGLSFRENQRIVAIYLVNVPGFVVAII